MGWHELAFTLAFNTQHWIAFSPRSETWTSVGSTGFIHCRIPSIILSTGRFLCASGLGTLTSAPFSYTRWQRIGGGVRTWAKTGTMSVIKSARTSIGKCTRAGVCTRIIWYECLWTQIWRGKSIVNIWVEEGEREDNQQILSWCIFADGFFST